MSKLTSAQEVAAAGDLYALCHFIGPMQKQALVHLVRGEEGSEFARILAELRRRIEAMPKTREADEENPVVHLHYFAGGSFNAWVIEKDMGDGTPDERQYQATAYVNLYGHDIADAELGYFSIQEAIDAGAELDLHWTPKPLRECAK